MGTLLRAAACSYLLPVVYVAKQRQLSEPVLVAASTAYTAEALVILSRGTAGRSFTYSPGIQTFLFPLKRSHCCRVAHASYSPRHDTTVFAVPAADSATTAAIACTYTTISVHSFKKNWAREGGREWLFGTRGVWDRHRYKVTGRVIGQVGHFTGWLAGLLAG